MSRLTPQGYRVSGTWVELEDYPNYAVSDEGKVMNTVTGYIKRISLNQFGIAMVNMSLDNTQTVRSVAVLVADAFLDRREYPRHFDTPIHLDGDKTNCRLDNLALRPRWFAVKYHRQFDDWERQNYHGARYPVELIDTGEYFETSWDAAIKYGLLDREIFEAMANGTVVFPHNFRFREVI